MHIVPSSYVHHLIWASKQYAYYTHEKKLKPKRQLLLFIFLEGEIIWWSLHSLYIAKLYLNTQTYLTGQPEFVGFWLAAHKTTQSLLNKQEIS